MKANDSISFFDKQFQQQARDRDFRLNPLEGTTYLDMFDAGGHCLFLRTELEARFAGWNILRSEFSDFEAPGGRNKSFATVIAQKPRITVNARSRDSDHEASVRRTD